MAADEQKQETNALAVYEKLSVATGMDANMIAVIHNSVAKGTNTYELAYFLSVAKAAGLNPFMKEVWCYKDHVGNLLVFTGRDGFLAKAQQSKDYKGMQSAVVFERDEFYLTLDTENNEFEDSYKVFHKIKPSIEGRGKILGAYCISYAYGKAPYGVWVEFARYNKGKFVWAAFPEDMIVKVAESKSLRKAFGINGVQSEYEFDVVGDHVEPITNVKPVPVDKSDDRLKQMIDAAKTKEELEKLKVHCKVVSTMQYWDAKMKTF